MDGYFIALLNHFTKGKKKKNNNVEQGYNKSRQQAMSLVECKAIGECTVLCKSTGERGMQRPHAHGRLPATNLASFVQQLRHLLPAGLTHPRNRVALGVLAMPARHARLRPCGLLPYPRPMVGVPQYGHTLDLIGPLALAWPVRAFRP